jgi:two-component system sensor histidine kinase MtrB
VELYFLYSEEAIERDLRQLGTVLSAGWLAVVAVAAFVGRVVAGRTLAPVAGASRAARRIAEGLLETRLPVTTDDEFGQWAESFNEMAEALQTKIAELQEAHARERRFTSDVAHELRTPLTALVSEASLLREHLERIPEGARRPADLLASDVARLRALVEDLMEISRLDAGAEEPARERVDLSRLIETTLASRGWADRVRVRASSLVVRSDPRRLERIVSNLVGNALDHGGTRVEVRVGEEGSSVVVEVTDDGPGIAPEHLPHVFERFYKADPARAARGSGLGLSIALEHTRLLGGDIEVESRVGVGTRFTLRLPVSEPLPARDGGVALAEDDGAGTEGEGGQP